MTASVEVEVEHRLVVVCWTDRDSIKVLTSHDGIRRYQKDLYDPRSEGADGPLEYHFDPAAALDAMREGKRIQMEWRAYEDLVRSVSEHRTGFGYDDLFDSDLVAEVVPLAFEPYTEYRRRQAEALRMGGEDPTCLDVRKKTSGRPRGRPKKSRA